MPTFLVCSETNSFDLEKKIKATFPDEVYVLRAGSQWLVEADETTSDMKEELEISEGNFGRVVVFKIDGYTGYHKKSLWEWLKL